MTSRQPAWAGALPSSAAGRLPVESRLSRAGDVTARLARAQGPGAASERKAARPARTPRPRCPAGAERLRAPSMAEAETSTPRTRRLGPASASAKPPTPQNRSQMISCLPPAPSGGSAVSAVTGLATGASPVSEAVRRPSAPAWATSPAPASPSPAAPTVRAGVGDLRLVHGASTPWNDRPRRRGRPEPRPGRCCRPEDGLPADPHRPGSGPGGGVELFGDHGTATQDEADHEIAVG